ncbi:MAG: PDC sensor domain-containing protein [Chitinispirillaceae bacterium]|nr:PDC sensor domain-containing protein [Chitinispirillaceae bacterium]
MNRSLPHSKPFTGMTHLAILVCCIGLSGPVSAETPQAEIDTFFTELSVQFDRIAANRAVKIRRPAANDAFFLRMLKRHQAVHSFVRTDKKGVRRTEMVRIKGSDHTKSSLKSEPWFSTIAEGAKAFHSLEKDTSNGRYYLIWSRPILLSNKAFAGVVMMKIDLWDCFHRISETTETPFMVRLKKTSFFSHKWKNEYRYESIPLEVPGVKDMTLLMQKSGNSAAVAAAADQDSSNPKSTMVKKESADADSSSFLGQGISVKTVVIAGGIGVFIIAIILVAMLLSWIRHKRIVKAIDEEF